MLKCDPGCYIQATNIKKYKHCLTCIHQYQYTETVGNNIASP